jgi:nitroreductase
MDFREVVLKRRMVRNWTDEPVAPDVIDRILDLSRHAPSAGFTQGQSFVVVTRPDLKQSIAALCGEEGYVQAGYHPFISGAPVLLIPCTSEAASTGSRIRRGPTARRFTGPCHTGSWTSAAP